MNILKLLTGRVGKAALTTTQAIVASAAVGVGGVVAWQMLGADSGADNAFNSLGYQQDEVVYVSSSTSGQYGRGENQQTAFRAAPSKAIEMQQREAEYLRQQEEERAAAERARYEAETRASGPESAPLGGLNEGLGNKKIEAMTPEQIKAMQEAALKQAKDAAAAGKANADAAALAAAAGVQGAAGRSSAMASRGFAMPDGASGSPTFVGMPGSVDSGKNGKRSDSAPAISGAGHEGAAIPNSRNLRARANFGGKISERQNSRDFSSLELMAKRSAEIAGNASRSANEGSRAFLASTRNSGGITLNGNEVSTGQGATSSDYGDASGALRGLNTKMDNLMDAEQEFKDARKSLRKNFWGLLSATILCMGFTIPYFGWLFFKKEFRRYDRKAREYNEKYGDRSNTGRKYGNLVRILKSAAKAGAGGWLIMTVKFIPALFKSYGQKLTKSDLKHRKGGETGADVGTVRSSAASNEGTLNVDEGVSSSDAAHRDMERFRQDNIK